jgi:hypothetical protein
MDCEAYPIGSIGYDKRDYVERIVGILADPEKFQPQHGPVLVPTSFVPRSTT